LNQDATQKQGQLAHIDRRPENNKANNAAFLCTEHHPQYDTVSRQTKGYTPKELRQYLQILYAHFESLKPTRHGRQKRVKSPNQGRVVVSLEVYDRRILTYRRALQFVRDVVKDLRPDIHMILKFAADVDEARFLFDEIVSDYEVVRICPEILLRRRDDGRGRHCRQGIWPDRWRAVSGVSGHLSGWSHPHR
jgi:hypothetical protein